MSLLKGFDLSTYPVQLEAQTERKGTQAETYLQTIKQKIGPCKFAKKNPGLTGKMRLTFKIRCVKNNLVKDMLSL